MSGYKEARDGADPYDPALCQAAMELLPRAGFTDGDSSPVFVRPSSSEDQELGIDMYMMTKHDTYKLAFRTCSYLSNILIRDKEMEKIRADKYKPDFFIIGVINPEDYSLSDVRGIDLKNWITHNKDAIEYDDFGERRDDSRGKGKQYYLIPPKDKGWPVIYHPMSFSGARRVPYKTVSKPPVIFLNMEEYNCSVEEDRAYCREHAKDLCDMLGLDACDPMRQMYEL